MGNAEGNALTLFAGAGGADLGLRAAGFQHLACVEADAHACATLAAAGFPAVRAWIGDGPQPKRRVRGQVQPPLPVFRYGGPRVDLLWASPPCQPYSRAGKRRGASDERDGWPATLAAIREVRPCWVVVENVVRSPVETWAGELRALYPHVQVWRADAVDWGLPSHRDRLYVVAGPRVWAPPAPTHYGPRLPWLLRGGRLPWVGFGDALGLIGAVRAARPSEAHLPVAEREEQIIKGPAQCIGATYRGNLAGQPYVLMETRRGRDGGAQWEATEASSPATCIRTPGGGSSLPSIRLVPGNGGNLPAPRAADQPAHTVTGHCPAYLLHPAPCVNTGEGKGHTCPDRERGRGTAISRAADALYLATGRRRLTPAEGAKLCGFPDDYPFQGPKDAHYRQIGNCVAPVMAEVIGRSILQAE